MNVQPHETCCVFLSPSFARMELLGRVRREFREMPGMRLSFEQAMRLWDLDRRVCKDVLDELLRSDVLRLDQFGRYQLHHGAR